MTWFPLPSPLRRFWAWLRRPSPTSILAAKTAVANLETLGMQAANHARAEQGYAQAYGEADFFAVAEQLNAAIPDDSP